MAFFDTRTKIVSIIFLFSISFVIKASAAPPVEKACLKFVDDLWFTAEHARINTPAKECYWNGDSFKARGVIVRTYMTLDFSPDFWVNPPSREYLKEHLAEEIIGNRNSGDLHVGDEIESASGYSWSKLLEAPIGDYGIMHQVGYKDNAVGFTDFYFLVDGCSVKIGGNAVPERQQDADELDYYGYLNQITTEKAQEIAAKLKNEPLCKIGIKPSGTNPVSSAENAPEVEALAENQPTNDDLPDPPEITQFLTGMPLYPSTQVPFIDVFIMNVEGTVEFRFPDGTIRTLTESDEPSELRGVYPITNTEIEKITDIDKYLVRVPLGTKVVTNSNSRVTAAAVGANTMYIEQGSEVSFESFTTTKMQQSFPDSPGISAFVLHRGFARVKHRDSRVPLTATQKRRENILQNGTWLEKYSILINPESEPIMIGTRGTDFSLYGNPETSRGIIELYDGEIDVTSSGGQTTKTLKTDYGSSIKRVEAGKDGALTEQIAISKDQWLARQTAAAPLNQPQTETQKQAKSSGLWWLILVLALGGGIFELYKKGKFQPIYQKLLERIKKQ